MTGCCRGRTTQLGTRALRFLEGKLSDIKVVVPEDKLKKLQSVTIVLDLTHGKLGADAVSPECRLAQGERLLGRPGEMRPHSLGRPTWRRSGTSTSNRG